MTDAHTSDEALVAPSDEALTERTLELLRELVACESVSPQDGGCQDILIARLEAIGFEAERLRFGDTDNFWARRGGDAPILALAGHTDVVPTGPLDAWHTPPFEPTIVDGYLYGRGAADMKSGLAAMVVAAECFIAQNPRHRGSLAFLVTSDEEADASDGTVRVVETLTERGTQIDYCVIGEPSSSETVGDVIRVGRRGSFGGRLTVTGIQGHVAYPDDANNPIHAALGALAELAGRTWDEGADVFPPTTFQISNIHAGTGAGNVIPGTLTCDFNFRFNTAQTADGMRRAVEQACAAITADWHVDLNLSGVPFFTDGGELIERTEAAILSVTGRQTQRSTSGGTSDGRFIAPTGTQVVELGVINKTIHQVNERVGLDELAPLVRMYLGVIERMLGAAP